MQDNNNPFLNLIYALHFSAMQGMGKIKNPLTDKIERNLQHAKESIDMLLLLRDKTKVIFQQKKMLYLPALSARFS